MGEFRFESDYNMWVPSPNGSAMKRCRVVWPCGSQLTVTGLSERCQVVLFAVFTWDCCKTWLAVPTLLWAAGWVFFFSVFFFLNSGRSSIHHNKNRRATFFTCGAGFGLPVSPSPIWPSKVWMIVKWPEKGNQRLHCKWLIIDVVTHLFC